MTPHAQQIVDALKSRGLLFRDEIEENCGLTRGEITKAVKVLKSMDLIKETYKSGARLLQLKERR